MTLNIGDAILAVEGQAVTTVQELQEALFKALKAKGYAAMVIEQPQEMMNKNVVRQALNSDPTESLPQKDVAIICGAELKRFQTNPELPPNKQILKDLKRSHKESSRVKVSEKAEDIPIACDSNPNLLMKVPIPNFQIQQAQTTQARSPPASSSQQK
jgi:hypothetical protein